MHVLSTMQVLPSARVCMSDSTTFNTVTSLLAARNSTYKYMTTDSPNTYFMFFQQYHLQTVIFTSLRTLTQCLTTLFINALQLKDCHRCRDFHGSKLILYGAKICA